MKVEVLYSVFERTSRSQRHDAGGAGLRDGFLRRAEDGVLDKVCVHDKTCCTTKTRLLTSWFQVGETIARSRSRLKSKQTKPSVSRSSSRRKETPGGPARKSGHKSSMNKFEKSPYALSSSQRALENRLIDLIPSSKL